MAWSKRTTASNAILAKKTDSQDQAAMRAVILLRTCSKFDSRHTFTNYGASVGLRMDEVHWGRSAPPTRKPMPIWPILGAPLFAVQRLYDRIVSAKLLDFGDRQLLSLAGAIGGNGYIGAAHHASICGIEITCVAHAGTAGASGSKQYAASKEQCH